MIILVSATIMSLSATVFKPDILITNEMSWSLLADCETVRQAQLEKHPAPNHIALACIEVPPFISEQYETIDRLQI